MVAPVYDHVTALIFACTLFVSAVVAVPAISYVNLLYLDQQQLRNVALEVLNAMLFGMGYPSDWGSDFDNIDKFGLALESSSFYVLDPEKVGRLSSSNPSGYLDYENVSALLGLQNYGFNIRIMPLFNVTVKNRSQGNKLLFDADVKFNDGRPIPGASVNSTIFYVLEIHGLENNFYFTTPLGNRTNELGECTISYQLPQVPTGYIIVLKVTVAEMATVTVPYIEGFAQNVASASIIGDLVNVTMPSEKLGAWGERRIFNVVSVSEDGTWQLYNNPKTDTTDNKLHWGKESPYACWYKTFTGLNYEDPLFLIFNIWTPKPRRLVLFVASPLLNIASGALTLAGQPSAQSASNAVIKLSRSVEIAGMTYIFELLFWKSG